MSPFVLKSIPFLILDEDVVEWPSCFTSALNSQEVRIRQTKNAGKNFITAVLLNEAKIN